MTVLADRGHAGDPLLNCLDAPGWGYVIRFAEDTLIETATGRDMYAAVSGRQLPTCNPQRATFTAGTLRGNVATGAPLLPP
jgi:hypothetical protein